MADQKPQPLRAWSVTVAIGGHHVLTISENEIHGVSSATKFTPEIREAAKRLRIFIGEDGNQ